MKGKIITEEVFGNKEKVCTRYTRLTIKRRQKMNNMVFMEMRSDI